MPTVSVLLPCRNAAAYVGEAISSILSQTFDDLELIVVDDGSTDRSAALAEQVSVDDDRARLVRRPHRGLVAALEFGRAEARGRFIARMDADDIALPERFGAQVRYLDAHDDVVAIGGQIDIIDSRGKQLGKGRYPVSPSRCRRHLELASPFCHPAVMMRREALNACGGYRSQYEYAEDYDLWLRLATVGELANLPDTVLCYRVHDKNLTSTSGHANAAASALAITEARHGLESVADALAVSRSSPWLDQEVHVKPAARDFARASYVRAAILNGAIRSDSIAEFAFQSLLDRRRGATEQPSRQALAFTLNRAATQSLRLGRRQRGLEYAALAVRRVPKEMIEDGLRSLRFKLFAQ